MSCAFTGCASPTCPVCSVNARFPPLVACGKPVDGKNCGQVVGHPYGCRPGRAGKVESADLRESEPVEPITNEQAVIALAYKRRRREGPVRQQR
jgi:hypothetical protein